MCLEEEWRMGLTNCGEYPNNETSRETCGTTVHFDNFRTRLNKNFKYYPEKLLLFKHTIYYYNMVLEFCSYCRCVSESGLRISGGKSGISSVLSFFITNQACFWNNAQSEGPVCILFIRQVRDLSIMATVCNNVQVHRFLSNRVLAEGIDYVVIPETSPIMIKGF